MEFIFKDDKYILVELVDPIKSETYDIIQVMKVKYDDEMQMEFYEFIGYFYGASIYNKTELIMKAKEYIKKTGE